MIEPMIAIPKNSILMLEWEKYKNTYEFQNTRKWALQLDHVEGALWATFVAGFDALKTEYERVVAERDRLRRELQRIANPIYPHPSIKTAETSYTHAELINIATRALEKDK